MCGFCGIADLSSSTEAKGEILRSMRDKLVRRGPDDEGMAFSMDGFVGFGFRRLSILDISHAGHQPMRSSNGAVTLVFNGEIYNYRTIREELRREGIGIRSSGDTAVLVEALALWGVDALSRLNGMFAIAWYDERNGTLTLARDHAAIKPLHYAYDHRRNSVAFASQFNCLLNVPWVSGASTRLDVLHLYFRLHYIPAPYGLFEDTWQVEAGQYVQFTREGGIRKGYWWQLPESSRRDIESSAAVPYVKDLVENAVSRQLVSDVPLGVYLSGGVDSPLVASFARANGPACLPTFTIGNPGWSQDEGLDAKRYADALGLDFGLWNLSDGDALSAIDDVIAAQTEPFADFSILPSVLLAQFARQDVTVALSGDGGDELFYGYVRPFSLLRNGEDFRHPRWFRRILYYLGRLGVSPRRSEVIVARTAGEYYFNVNGRLRVDELRSIAPGLPEIPSDYSLYESGSIHDFTKLADFSRRVEYYGQLQRCLKKVDLASMYHSLEVRVPLLDREVVESSFLVDFIPDLRAGRRKRILTDLLATQVPPELIHRKKRGFAVPLGDWLRSSLRERVEDTLSSQGRWTSVFDGLALQQYWQQHLSGERDNKWGLWTILSYLWWLEAHGSRQ